LRRAEAKDPKALASRDRILCSNKEGIPLQIGRITKDAGRKGKMGSEGG